MPTLPTRISNPEFGKLAGWGKNGPEESWEKVKIGYTNNEIQAIKDAGVKKSDILSWKTRYENMDAIRISKGSSVDTPAARAILMQKILEKW